MKSLYYVVQKIKLRLVPILVLWSLSVLSFDSAYGQDMVRNYASAQQSGSGGLGVASVSNPSNAVDGDPFTYSVLNPVLLSSAWQQLSYGTTKVAGTNSYIKIGFGDDLLSLLGDINIQAYNNGSPVGTSVTLGSLLTLVSGSGSEEIVFQPVNSGGTPVAYDAVRITSSAVLSADTGLRVYHTYVMEDAGVSLACEEKNSAVDVLSGVTGAVLSGLVTVTNPSNAIGDPDVYSTMSVAVGALNTAYLTTIFQSPSEANQVVRIVLEQPGSLLELGLLSGFTIQPYLGSTAVGSPIVGDSNLITARLLGGSDKYELVLPVTGSFDRVQIELSNTVTALTDIRIYEVSRLPRVDLLDEPELSDVLEACGQVALSSAVGNYEPDYYDYFYYTSSTGGTALATSSVTTSGTYYIEAVDKVTGCISDRVAVNAVVNPFPEISFNGDISFSITPGESVTFPTASAPGANIQWYDYNGNAMAAAPTTVTFENEGIYTYRVEAVTPAGCTTSTQVSVIVSADCSPVYARAYNTAQDFELSQIPILGGNLGQISNPGNASDGDISTYSELTEPINLLGLLGETSQTLSWGSTINAGRRITVKLGRSYGLASVAGGVYVVPVDSGGNELGPRRLADPNLAALANGLNVYEYSFIPTDNSGVAIPFDGIKIVVDAVANVIQTARIYGAYYHNAEQSFTCSGEDSIDVYGGYETLLLNANLATALVTVSNEENAIDGDLSTFASLNNTAALNAYNKLVVAFETPSVPGDTLDIVFGHSGSLLDLNLLSALRIQRYLGGIPVEEPLTVNSALIGLRLLSGGNVAVASVPADVAYDGVKITYGGVASALEQFNIYEVRRRAATQFADGEGALNEVALCSGEAITFDDLPTDCGTSYVLYDAENGGSQVPLSDIPNLGAGQYSYWIQPVRYGCESLARGILTLNINDVPEAPSVTPENAWAAPGGAVTLEVQDPDENITYNWYDAATDGTLVFTGDTFEVTGVTTDISYYVEAVAGESCISAARTEVTITVLMPPTIDPVGATITQGETVPFEGLSPDGTEVVWYDPDGNEVATGPEYTIPDNLLPGDYVYTATTRDPVSGAESEPVEIPVTVQPLVLNAPTVTPPSAVIDEGDSQTFTATHDMAGVTFTWYDPDGNIVATTPEYTTPANLPVGDYTYTVTATDPSTGVVSPPAEVPVSVQAMGGGLVPPTVTPPTAVIGEGDTQLFTASHDTPGVTYIWYDPDGNQVATTPEFTTPANLAVGDYTYTVTATDPDSGEVSDPAQVQLTVEPAGTLLPPAVDPASATIEEGETASFTASHDNPDVTFTWYDPDGNVVATTPEYTTPANLPVGDHIYTVTVTDPDSGEESEPTEVVVTVEPASGGTLLPPTVTPPSATVMVGDTETFTASHDNPDVTFTWYDNDDNVVATTPEYTIPDDLAIGDYTYKVTVTDPDSGEESAPTEVPVSVVPVDSLLPPTVTPASATIEEGETETFTASHDNPDVTFTWYDPDGNVVATTPEYTTPDNLPVGDHIYTVTVTDPDSGEESEPTEVVVTVTPAAAELLPPSVDPLQATIDEGETAMFTASTDYPNGVIVWYDADGNEVNIGEEFIAGVGLPAGTYTYNVVVRDPDTNEESTPVQVTLNILSVTPPLECLPAYERVYAGSQSASAAGVQNNANAIDGNLDTHSTIIAPSLGMTYYQQMNFGQSFSTGAGDELHVRIGTQVGLSVGSVTVTVRAYNGTTAVGTPVQLSSGVLLNLLSGENEADVVIPDPGTSFNAVRVSVTGGLISAGDIDIYAAYVNRAVETLAECVPVEDILVGSTSGVLGDLNKVTNEGNVADGDLNTAANLRQNVGVAGYVHLTTLYSAPSVAGDSIRIVLADQNAGLLDLGLLSAIKVIAYKGNTPVHEATVDDGLLSLKLLGGANQYEVATQVDQPFDRISIQFDALVSALTGVDIFEIERVPVIQVDGNDPGDRAVEACQGGTVSLAAPTDDCTTYVWYDERNGGNLIGEGNLEFEIPADWTPGEHIVYVQPVRYGCEESGRTAVTIEVKEAPGADDIVVETDQPDYCENEEVVITATADALTTPVFAWYTDADKENPVADANGVTYTIVNGELSVTGLEAGTYTYYVSVKDGEDGCESLAGDLAEVSVVIKPGATAADIQTTDQVICMGETAVLEASSTTISDPVFNWYDNEDLTGDAVFTGPVFEQNGLAAGLYTYYITVQNDDTCESTAEEAVAVTIAVQHQITSDDIVLPGDLSQCLGSPVALSAGINTAITVENPVFAWYFDAAGTQQITDGIVMDGATYTVNGADLTVEGLAEGTVINYYVSLEGDNVCGSLDGDLATVQVTIGNELEAPEVSETDVSVCEGDDAVLSVLNPQSNLQYNWYETETGGTAVFTGIEFTLTAVTQDAVYYVEAQGDGDCASLTRTEVTVTVKDYATAADITIDGVTEICEYDDLVLTPSTGIAAPVFRWYANADKTGEITDGVSADGVLTLSGLTEGTYTYYVSVASDELCENQAGDLAEVEVSVGSPQAAPVVSPPEQFVVVGETAAAFEVSGVTSGEVVWYNDEQLQTEVFRGTSYVPSAGVVGNYTYYVVIEEGACVSEVTQVILHVTDLPTPPEECYIADAQENGTTFGCVLCSVQNPTNAIDDDTDNFTRLSIPAGLGSGSVYQTLIFSHTGKAGDSVLVDIATPVGLGDINILGGITVTLFNGTTQVDQYSLENPLLEIRLLTGGQRGQVLIPASGAYDRVEIRNTAGVATLLQSVDIYGAQIIQAAPELDIPDPVELCEGEEYIVSATPAAGTVLRWYNSDDELLFTGSNFEIPSDVAGSFTYFIEVVDQASGCPSPDRIAFDVIVNDSPGADDIAVTGNEDPVCADDDVVLTPSSASGTVFRWYMDADKMEPIADGDSDGDVSYAIAANGVLTISGLDSNQSPYTYYVSVEGTNGCENPAGDLAVVNVEITPTVPEDNIAGIEIETTNGDGEVCLNVTPDVVIIATLTPGSTVTNPVFYWYDETGNMVAGGENGTLTLTGLTPGTYTYSVGVSGDGFCETAEGDRKNITFVARDDCQLINAVDDIASTPVDIPVTIDVLANDVAGESPIDPATVMIITAPGNGMVAVDPVTGMVTYAPASGYEGNDIFTYTVKDEDGFESNEATVTVTVGGDNGGLLAVDDSAATPEDIAVDIDVLANDVAGNADIDPTSVTIAEAPVSGSVTVNATTGVVTYTPASGYAGTDTFTYTMKDEDGYTSNTATVTVTVGGDNGGLLAVDDSASTPMEMPVAIDVLANDEAGNSPIDLTSVTIVTMPGEGTVTVDAATGVVTYTSSGDFEGDDTFTYTMKDEAGYTSNEAMVTVSVGGDNGGLLAVDDSAATPEDIAVDIDVLANDVAGNADIDPTSVTIAEAPVSGSVTVNATTGVVTYTPASGYAGTDTFTYTMKDEDGYTSNTATVTVTVGGDNGGLLAVDDSASTPMEMPVAIDVLANDEAGNSPIDLTSVTIVTMPGEGTVTVDAATGVVTYTSSGDFEGDDTFTYTMKDEAGYTSNEATVTVSVGGDNGGLLAVDDSAATPEDIAVDIDVLANDVAGNADIDPTSVTIAEAPVSGSVTVNATTGVVTYTPASGYAGTDTFTYTMKDEDGYTSNTATVTVTVGGDNGGLLAVDDSASTPMEMPVAIDVLANDEAGNSPIDLTSVTIVTMPGEGTVTVDAATGVVTYTSSGDFEGDDTFTYTMKDEAGYTSNEATVTVSVGGDNGGLLAVDDSAATPEDIAVDIDVLANDVAGNADIDPTSVTIAEAPVSGSVTVNATTGVVTYTPASGYAGTDTFTYTMKDEDGYTSNAATVTVTVGGDNGGLLAVDDSASTPMEMPVAIDVLANDEAGNSPIDLTSVTIVTMPGEGTVTVDAATGVVTYTSSGDFEGDDTFTYTMKDEAGYTSNEATVTVSVGGDNGGLLAVDDSAATPEDIAVDIDVLANDVAGNADIDPTSVTIAEAPVSGSVTVNATTGVVTYTPASGYAGTDTFTYTMKDEDGYTSNAATVTVTVGGDNGGLLAVDDSASTPMEMPVAIDVLANDEAGNSPIDLTSVTIVTMPGEGTVTVDAATGVVTYTSSGDFEGDDTFTYTMKDEAGYTSNEATVTVSVGGNNGGLMAVDDNASTPVDVAVAIDVLANDVAGNAIIDAGSVAILTMPSSGGVEVNASTGVVTYTPDNGFEGTDTFTYTMKDVDGYTSNEATVTVNVGGNNGGLMAADDSAGTIVDTPVTVDILANDTGGNAPLDPASVAIATMPSDGNVEILVSNGAVTYTPDAGFIGTDTFTYTVNDTDGYTSNVATVTITVDPAPTGPIANDDAVQVNPNSFVSIAILDNDAEGSAPIDPASVSIVTEPAHGDYSVTAEGVVDYIPEAGFVGQDSFEYTVEDIDGRVSNVAVVSIDVTSDSDLAITITVDEVTPSIDSNVEFTITITNDGDQVFSNIVVDESLPSGYEFVGSQSAEGDYNNITAKWTISHIGAQGTAMLKLTAKVVAVAGADYLNVVTIEESSPVDSNLENNTAQVAVEPLLLVVYNEFSPNGDGFNDTFVIDGIQLYPNNVLKVYNRYGSLVFQTSNYNNDWDGVANKSGAIMSKDRLPVGTYFYVLDTGTGIKKSGWLYIAR